MKRILASVYSLIILLILALAFGSNLHAEKMKPKAKGVSGAECYDCHDTIKDLHKSGKHVKVGCINCHSDLEKHLANPGAGYKTPHKHFLGGLWKMPQRAVQIILRGSLPQARTGRKIPAHQQSTKPLLG